MKTEGLTLLEAGRALKDGKCSEIYSPSTTSRWANYTLLAEAHFRHLERDFATTDWQLIDPVPEKRTAAMVGVGYICCIAGLMCLVALAPALEVKP